ncbi:hypothetical protein RP300_00291 [Oligella urethralis]|uniref:Predicted periplasmic/secreted protein n=1 Tax=Oligella urethralis TaxID=90245 RepID=A0A2X1UQD8_9BURK|nr:SIMPL domain-containing protein [Oligella urethralis]WOS36760.1 hypothetical protein RP300_00291 [Oligella urethralis]SPY09306.1 Predicted periplasmic/secreted protein [Oligella urethralis]
MRYFKALVFIPLLLSTSMAFAAEQREPESYVRVGAEAFREVAEDRANVILTKEIDGADERQLLRDVNLAMRRVAERAKEYPELSLETGDYSVRKHTQYKKDTNQIEKITYTAVGKMIARSKNFDELLKFVEASHEDMLVDDIRFDVSSELRQTIEKEILEEAITSFRGKAETVAKGLGYEGFEVRNIDVNDSAATAPIRRPPLRPMMARAMTAERVEEGYAEAPPLEAGKQMVRVSVSGQIVLK